MPDRACLGIDPKTNIYNVFIMLPRLYIHRSLAKVANPTARVVSRASKRTLSISEIAIILSVNNGMKILAQPETPARGEFGTLGTRDKGKMITYAVLEKPVMLVWRAWQFSHYAGR